MKKRSLTKIFLINLLPSSLLFRGFFGLAGLLRYLRPWIIISAGLVLITYASIFYYFYWLWSTRNELVAKGSAVPPAWPIFISLLLAAASYVTAMASHRLAWLYGGPITLFILSSLFLVFYYLYFLHKYVQAYYKLGILKKTVFNYFLLILLIPFVGQFIFQYMINEKNDHNN
jgi:hypothetical protein